MSRILYAISGSDGPVERGTLCVGRGIEEVNGLKCKVSLCGGPPYYQDTDGLLVSFPGSDAGCGAGTGG